MIDPKHLAKAISIDCCDIILPINRKIVSYQNLAKCNRRTHRRITGEYYMIIFRPGAEN